MFVTECALLYTTPYLFNFYYYYHICISVTVSD
jgi:hypothetical protein